MVGVLKYYYKTNEEMSVKRAKNEFFKHPCKYFVIN